MQNVAEFHKVSFSQFMQDSKKNGFITNETDPETVKVIWERIKLPTRGTIGSAGYDFFAPYPFSIEPGVNVTIPTGIRAEIQEGWSLWLVPRSGLGFKHGLRLRNSVGICDSDYAYADNEGHIMVKISVEVPLYLNEGDRFIQGIFMPFGITRSDQPLNTERKGGFGSTGVA